MKVQRADKGQLHPQDAYFWKNPTRRYRLLAKIAVIFFCILLEKCPGRTLVMPIWSGIRKMSEFHPQTFDNLIVEKVKPFVYNVQLNRPKKMNALSKELWR